MQTSTIPTSQWLKKLQEEYSSIIRQSVFFKTLAEASSPADFNWIRQLYYLSCDFTAAVALRYGGCQDPRFRNAFGEHAAEEVTHPADLAEWMREFGFLASDEEPTSVPPTLETLAICAYLIRSVIREPIAHQIITINLMSESIACDLFSAVNPKLAELGLTPKGYWEAHAKADMRHQVLGLDLLPQCDPDSSSGNAYVRIAWEVASLFKQMFDSWGGIPVEQKVKLADPADFTFN
ncbi:MAG: iron-containing redox enzyme family protein [Methylobacter sp.]|jgi:hypothetical protein